jgi:hypothetical protein
MITFTDVGSASRAHCCRPHSVVPEGQFSPQLGKYRWSGQSNSSRFPAPLEPSNPPMISAATVAVADDDRHRWDPNPPVETSDWCRTDPAHHLPNYLPRIEVKSVARPLTLKALLLSERHEQESGRGDSECDSILVATPKIGLAPFVLSSTCFNERAATEEQKEGHDRADTEHPNKHNLNHQRPPISTDRKSSGEVPCQSKLPLLSVRYICA